jgi:hypothetical protein
MKKTIVFLIIAVLFLSCGTSVRMRVRTRENRITWHNTDEYFVIEINTTKNPKNYIVDHIAARVSYFDYKEDDADIFYDVRFDTKKYFHTTFDSKTFYIYVDKEALDNIYPYDKIYYVRVFVWRKGWGCYTGYKNLENYVP